MKRYWGKYDFGSPSKRYSSNSISLDLLSIACGFKNWDMYEKANGNTFVTNVLPYEQNLSFFNNGFWHATNSKPGDIFYFGDATKYIALEKVFNGFMVVDFKNVFAFKNFTELDLTGVEVDNETDDKLHIRLHYKILDLNHYLSSAYDDTCFSDAKNAKQDLNKKISLHKIS